MMEERNTKRREKNMDKSTETRIYKPSSRNTKQCEYKKGLFMTMWMENTGRNKITGRTLWGIFIIKYFKVIFIIYCAKMGKIKLLNRFVNSFFCNI